MKKRILPILLTILIIAQIFLASCSSQGETESFLTEEQLTSDHLILEEELTDKVRVDADITPYDRYKDGVNAYYISMQDNTVWISEEEFEEKVAEMLACLREHSPAGEEQEREWLNDGSNPLRIQMADTQVGGIRELLLFWTHGSEKYKSIPNSFDYSYSVSDVDHNGACWLITRRSYEGGELFFAGPEEAEREARAVLEELTGKSYAEYYRYVAVDETARDIMRENNFLAPDSRIPEVSQVYLERDYYAFFFYQEVDGFICKYLNLNTTREDNTDIGSDVSYDPLTNVMFPPVMTNQMITIGQEGVRCVLYMPGSRPGELYRDKEKVCDVGQILERTKEYFESTYISDELTIVSVELMYSGWFSDPSEGTIHSTVAPFWVVRYRNEYTKFQYELIFDAYTGKYIGYFDATL